MKTFKQFILTEILASIPQDVEGETSELEDSDGKNIFFTKNIKGKTGVHTYTYHAKLNDNQAHINFWMDEGITEITDEGNAAQVLTAAMYFISQVAAKYQPEKITFEALKGMDSRESKSRGDVYLRLLNKFANSRGYKIGRDSTTGKDVFTLTK